MSNKEIYQLKLFLSGLLVLTKQKCFIIILHLQFKEWPIKLIWNV